MGEERIELEKLNIVLFQDLKELIQVTPAIKTIGNIANVKGYKM